MYSVVISGLIKYLERRCCEFELLMYKNPFESREGGGQTGQHDLEPRQLLEKALATNSNTAKILQIQLSAKTTETHEKRNEEKQNKNHGRPRK